MMKMRKQFKFGLIASAVFIMLLAINAFALQEASAPQSAPASTPSAQKPAATPSGSRLDEFAPQSASGSQELAHASNEAAGEDDETAAFKFSPSVGWIAKHTGLSVTTAYWLSVVLNFAVIAIAVVLFMKSKMPAAFRGRTQSIQKDIQEARHSSEDAQRRLSEIESRLSRMNLEIEGMQSKAEADARAEEERMRTAIQQEKQKILQSAEQEVEQAASAARRDLQKYAAALAIEMAEKGIRVDAGEDKLLVEDFTAQLASQTNRNGGS